MKYNRLDDIEKEIKLHKTLTNEELCSKFDISMQTLYRDLKILQEKGEIRKVYGGVIYDDRQISKTLPSLDERTQALEKEKIKLGEAAAKLVEDNDIIFVDAGSTTVHIIPFLTEKKNITIVTHSLTVMEEISKHESLKGIMLGGKLNHETKTFSANFNRIPFYYHKAFIATVGADLDALTNMYIDDGNIKKEAIEQSEKTYLVLDHTKFKNKGFNIFAHIQDMNAVITDDIPKDMLKELKRLGIETIIAN